MDLAVVMSDNKEIKDSDFNLSVSDNGVSMNGKELTMREYNLELLNVYLRKHDNNISLVADKLDISQATIYRMLKEAKA